MWNEFTNVIINSSIRFLFHIPRILLRSKLSVSSLVSESGEFESFILPASGEPGCSAIVILLRIVHFSNDFYTFSNKDIEVEGVTWVQT